MAWPSCERPTTVRSVFSVRCRQQRARWTLAAGSTACRAPSARARSGVVPAPPVASLAMDCGTLGRLHSMTEYEIRLERLQQVPAWPRTPPSARRLRQGPGARGSRRRTVISNAQVDWQQRIAETFNPYAPAATAGCRDVCVLASFSAVVERPSVEYGLPTSAHAATHTLLGVLRPARCKHSVLTSISLLPLPAETGLGRRWKRSSRAPAGPQTQACSRTLAASGRRTPSALSAAGSRARHLRRWEAWRCRHGCGMRRPRRLHWSAACRHS